jgi:hypothetical protein
MTDIEKTNGTPGVVTPEVLEPSGKKNRKKVSLEERRFREAKRTLDSRDMDEADLLLQKAAPAAAMAMIGLLQSDKEMIRLKAAEMILNRVGGTPERVSKMREMGRTKPIVLMWQDTALEVKSVKAAPAEPVKELQPGEGKC